tara:strand:- start:4471 stop:8415 length:3945 start_codon:yes stop_codon:yes gene_type:complete
MSERFDEEGFVAGSFDPIKIYDAPMVALSQIFDGEASWRSLKDTFLDPSALSPAERDSFIGRIKQSTGNNPLTNSVIDVATNPFVWLLFVTSPAAANALKKGGKVFSGLAKKHGEGGEYFRFVTGQYSPLKMLGLLNAHQLGAGTPLNPLLHSIQSRFSELANKDTLSRKPFLDGVLDTISKKFGVEVTSLDPDRAAAAKAVVGGETVTLKDYLKKANVYSHMHMAGMNKDMLKSSAELAENFKLKMSLGSKNYSAPVPTKTKARIDDLQNKIWNIRNQVMKIIKEEGRDPVALTAILKHRINQRNRIVKAVFKKEGIDVGDIGIRDSPRIQTTPILPDKFAFEEGGPLRVHSVQKEVQAIDGENVSGKWLEREGFMPLLDFSKSMQKSRYVELFADENAWAETGKIVYDENKILRIFHSLSTNPNSKSAVEISNVLDKELAGHVGPNAFNKIIDMITPDEKGRVKMSISQFKDLLVSVRSTSDDMDNYMSRNVWTYVEPPTEVMGGPRKYRTDSIRVSAKDRNPSVSGRVQERIIETPYIDTDDLSILWDDYEKLGLAKSDKANNLKNQLIRSRKFELNAGSAEGGRVQVMNLDYETSFNRYLNSTRNDLVLHIDDAWQDRHLMSAREQPEWAQMIKSGRPGTRRVKARRALEAEGSMGRTRYDHLKFITDSMATTDDIAGRRGGEYTRDFVMDTLIERMRGAKPMKDMISEHATMSAVKAAATLANSKAFKKIESMGGYGARFVQKLREYGDMNLTDTRGQEAGRGLTKLFYLSHLGFNLSSVALNLMQPLLYAANWTDPGVLIKAYSNAFRQYFGYIADRRKLPLNADKALVDELRGKHFRLSNVSREGGKFGDDLLDIRATDFELYDSQAFAGSETRGRTGLSWWATDAPMKMFTHSELFNRIVTGEAILEQSKKAGRLSGLNYDTASKTYRVVGGGKFSDIELMQNTKDMVQNTQFGSDLMNSPKLFQDSGWGVPWVRQFFTFPVRTITAWTDSAPMIDQGRRTWGALGFTTQGRYTAMAHDLMRMMGTSAIIYEVGKNAAGVDMSRGLAGQAMYESSTVAPFLLEEESNASYNLPLSPAFDVVVDSFRAITDDDKSLIGSLAPRFIPGGISFSRMLNVAPRIADQKGYLGGLQRESADWGAMNEQGQIPIYRADGSLLEYRSAAKTIMGAMGFGTYMFQNDKELNSFLVKNRQAVIDERRKYLDAVLANNMSKAAGVKANFEKRFKFPLTITKDQVDRAIQLREVPLKERMYQRLQPDFRPVVKPYLMERMETLKARNEEELDLSTAEKARVLPSTFETYDPYSAVTE